MARRSSSSAIAERGEVSRGPGALDRDEHVGELVLDRLERADRDTELLALLGVLERHLEDRLAGAHRLECERDAGLLERTAQAARGILPEVAEQAVRWHRHRVEHDAGEGSRAVEGLDRLEYEGARRDDEDGDAAVAFTDACDHRDLVRLGGAEDAGLATVELPAALDRCRGRAHGARVDARARLGHRERADEVAVQDRGEEAVLLISGPELPDDRSELGDRRHERPGCQDAAELLDHDGQLDSPEAQPTEVLRDREGGPAELDHLRPEPRRRRAVLDDGTHEAHRALTAENAAHAVPQLLLLRR